MVIVYKSVFIIFFFFKLGCDTFIMEKMDALFEKKKKNVFCFVLNLQQHQKCKSFLFIARFTSKVLPS